MLYIEEDSNLPWYFEWYFELGVHHEPERFTYHLPGGSNA